MYNVQTCLSLILTCKTTLALQNCSCPCKNQNWKCETADLKLSHLERVFLWQSQGLITSCCSGNLVMLLPQTGGNTGPENQASSGKGMNLYNFVKINRSNNTMSANIGKMCLSIKVYVTFLPFTVYIFRKM